jgi:hypothetical protein
MKPILDFAVLSLVIVAMTTIGPRLMVADSRQVAGRFRLVLSAIVGQLLIVALVLGHVEFAIFAAAYFVCQVPLLLVAAAVSGRVRVVAVDVTAGASRP